MSYKQPRKDGIKYVLCQHLEEGTQDWECWSHWAGDNLRFILCPVCFNQTLGSFVRNANVASLLYQQIDLKADKEIDV